VWGLEVDGKGNLGGPTLYWNQTGKVVVNGILYSTEGKIGGLNIGSTTMFTVDEIHNYNPLVISSTGYGYGENQTNLPYIQLQSHDSTGTVKHRNIMTSRGNFALVNVNPNLTNPTWNDFVSISNPGIIFNLTIIPIHSTVIGRPTLYVRYFCNVSAFSYVYVGWQAGYYALNFPHMETNDNNHKGFQQREWFIEQLVKGNISFQITGHNEGYCDENYEDAITIVNSSKFVDS